MKKILCVFLSLLFIMPLGVSAHAESTEEGELKFVAYNVSGIPLVGDFQGSGFTTTKQRATLIGQYLNSLEVDFIGTEEDFNAHKYLAAEMENYPYRSYTSGGLAQGQGLNIFSGHRIYNLDRVIWNTEYGTISGSMDAISNKGFIYCLMELKEGVYIDVITVHMDAGFDRLSVEARADNFKQLAAYINENLDSGRALVVLGDFNYKFLRRLNDDIYNNLLLPTGLKDVWAEVYNGGSYDANADDFNYDLSGDSLDRALFRSGSYMTLTPVSKELLTFETESGKTVTDHDPMLIEFNYTLTGSEPVPEILAEPEAEDELILTLKEFVWMFVRLFQVILGLTELPYLIGQGIDILLHGNMP
ncbi:MAG: hypothetical protein J1E34_04405 [Oscillospiraceae bacterium]|nr:hypothetical protein [Oscillospiraceae bacterium]